jgi:hypothetical protein
MHNEIKIQKECFEFINLQICGKCHEAERKGLTFINVNREGKSLLKHIQGFLYFGEPLNFTADQLKSVQKVLSKLKTKVTPSEMNLINYLSLLVSGSRDMATFKNLQMYYSKAIAKQQKRHLVGS